MTREELKERCTNQIELIEKLAERKGEKPWGRFYEEQKLILELLLELESKWTPVSEGLPKEDETVIASTEDGVFPEAKYSEQYGWEWAYEAGMEYWVTLEGVTAWMPLPKKYEPKESEDIKNA